MSAVLGGSFDPITYGHLDLARRGVGLFGEVWIAVGQNPSKSYTFSQEERIRLVRESTREIEGVQVRPFQGLLVDFAREVGARVLLRGVRSASDLDAELSMGLTNRDLDGAIETVLLLPSFDYLLISSSRVREIAAGGGSVDRYVPQVVAEALDLHHRTEKDLDIQQP